MTMMSVPSTTSRLSGEASMSMGKQRAGRRLAKRSSSLRSARSPRSGLRSCGAWSHLGPPTAPNTMAWASLHSASVAGGSGAPVASMAHPPMSACSNSRSKPPGLAANSSTRTASGVTSCPMPSPGSTAIRHVVIALPSSAGFAGAILSWGRPRRGPSRPPPISLRPDFFHALGVRVHHTVEGVEVCAGARLDDIRGGALARHHGAVEVHLDRDLAERVLAGRRRPDGIVLEPALEPGDGVDGRQRGIDGPVAHAGGLEQLALLSQPHRRRRYDTRSADDVQVVQLEHFRDLRRLVGDDGEQILVIDFLLAIGEILELPERAVEVGALELEAQVLEPGGQRVPARVLAEDELVRRAPDVLGLHDLVGELLLEHGVLVDARLVRERILPDARLVGLHVHTGDVRQEPRGPEDLLRPHPGLDAEEVLPRPQRHHDLLERGVAGPLADPVDGALDLAGAVHEGRQRVRHRLPEVVVAVHGHHDLLDPVDALANLADTLSPLLGDGVPDGVRDVDGPGAGVDDSREHVAHVVEVRARGVFRRELHVLAVTAGMT